MEQERCAICKFSRPDLSDTWLECHRNPPVINKDDDGIFPDVLDNNWCGEYENDPTKTITEA